MMTTSPFSLAPLLLLAVLGCRPASSSPAAGAEGSAPTPPSPSMNPVEASGEQAAPAVTVEFWHDFSCPWCRIGHVNLGRAVEGLDGIDVEIVYRPYLLDPSLPTEGADLRARLGERYGQERVEGMFARVTEAGAGYGVTFRWQNVTISPATTATHAVLAWAPDEARHELVDAIHTAYFERGENIGDPAVLGALAAVVGLVGDAARIVAADPAALAAVRAAVETSRSVRGVPHVVIGGQTVQGAQPVEVYRAAIESAAAEEVP